MAVSIAPMSVTRQDAPVEIEYHEIDFATVISIVRTERTSSVVSVKKKKNRYFIFCIYTVEINDKIYLF